jgi:hypothetical protein
MASTEHTLAALHAQTLAIQAVLTNVLHEMKLLDPLLADVVARGFDNAANQIEGFASPADKTVPSEQLVKALSIIENLRTATLGRNEEARHGV